MQLKRTFKIHALKNDIVPQLQQKIDAKTKPPGSLGKLERLARKIGHIQNTLTPELHKPTVLVFAGDHGVAAEGVSAFPQEVTQQMVANFLTGGAAINVFARQHNMDLFVIDAGVHGELPQHPQLLPRKVAFGTKNFRYEPAMTAEQCEEAVTHGAELVRDLKQQGCNIIICGEMGIANSSSASLLLSLLGNIPITKCVGPGTGLTASGVKHKVEILQESITANPIDAGNPFAVLTTFGGFEIAMMCGAYLQAAAERMVILVDGFISSSALLTASRLYPDILDYCVFGHLSDEPGHQSMLELMHAEPLLRMDLRLGEGTGAVLAYPLVESALKFLDEMASFESAGVSSAS
ncbi:nicotinate-nucleotide--dimethylbenzimidazole phosphoribosyltransferase [candidate division KSB3 bacterium]|uniref:Nicotinate-nucleotide--dimethylbenzimidazole phosphoribosyltransferase n=1 Tax=candidate division KSB3 bacterium TaxID=2044937 RepID=A0A2G6EAB7_9BACT|nr:MAG: nicotinate-nucleotide--dimethylbenzimidazole phosphoribosyltransferase [candidate division KSB3 bacterium]PIE30853.1 MAG: nicotinate-nucleotide--dimethylbenzimidazole phosphoribosyltransferase [candidate division KSB3 bacterium]